MRAVGTRGTKEPHRVTRKGTAAPKKEREKGKRPPRRVLLEYLRKGPTTQCPVDDDIKEGRDGTIMSWIPLLHLQSVTFSPFSVVSTT